MQKRQNLLRLRKGVQTETTIHFVGSFSIIVVLITSRNLIDIENSFKRCHAIWFNEDGFNSDVVSIF